MTGALSLAVSLLLGLLSVFLFTKRRSGTDCLLALILGVLSAMSGFDGLTLSEVNPQRYKIVVLYLKSLLPALVLGYGVLFARKPVAQSSYWSWTVPLLFGLAFPIVVVWLPFSEFYLDLDLRESRIVPLGTAGYWFYMGIMVYCIAALATIESTFARSTGAARWRIKYEFFGMVAILGILIFYFSQGLLFRSVNMNLLPVRSGVFLVAGVFIAYAKLFRSGSTGISVSRFVVYRSLTLLVVGLYLLGLGLVGSGFRYLGVEVSDELMLFLGIGSALLLLVLSFSEQIRRRAKVFVNKHFYAHKYDYRAEWLKFSERLAVCRTLHDVQRAIVHTFSEVFGGEGTALYLWERTAQRFVLASMEREEDIAREFELPPALRDYFLERNRVLNVQDAEVELPAGVRETLRQSGVWLVVPIPSHSFVEGLVMLRQRLLREDLTFEDFDMMKTLARQAGLSLMSHRLAAELSEAGELAAIAKVSSFVVHDLKNMAYTFSLMLGNAEQYLGEKEFQKDLLQSLRGSVDKMNALTMKLRALPQAGKPGAEPVDLAGIAQETLRQLGGLRPGVRIACDAQPAGVRGGAADFGRIALNLVINAADAVGEQGEIRVRTGSRDGQAFLSVQDTGPGMSDYFVRHHLFKPFRTTKDGGLGIGLYQCSQIAEAHGGRIEVESQVGKGSTFTVYFPADSP